MVNWDNEGVKPLPETSTEAIQALPQKPSDGLRRRVEDVIMNIGRIFRREDVPDPKED
jgi:hypothetical protein